MNDIVVKCKSIWFGLGIVIIIGMVVFFLSEYYNVFVMLFVLFLGMVVLFLY